MTVIFFAITLNFGHYLIYNIPLLIKEPPLLCRHLNSTEPWLSECPKELACRSDYEHELNRNNPYYLDNWITDLHLECASAGTISWLGSIYFICYAFGFVLFPIANVSARRLSYIPSLYVYVVSYFVILIVRNYYVVLVSVGMMGFMHIKQTLGFVYMLELIPDKQRTTACTIINIFDAMTMVISSAYYLLISQDWIYLQIVAFTVGLLFVVFCNPIFPESPLFLISRGKY